MASDDGLLSCLSPSQRLRLFECHDRSAYGPGRTIVWRGELLSRVFLLERGDAEAAYPTRLSPAVLRLNPGELFGEAPLLEGGPSDARVRASGDGALVLDFPADAFRALMRENAELHHRLLELAALRRCALGGPILGPAV